MGKIIYNPKVTKRDESVKESIEREHQQTNRLDALIENLNSVRPIGDTDCDYAVYLEDYAYTYIYQYAQADLSCEHSAVIIGEYYPDTKETIICGVMPVPKHKLERVDEWVNQEVIESLYEERDKYFPGASILGWLHMQPGYGTMLTMKEVKVHRDLFNKEGSILLLVDPINRLETFFVYEDNMLKEQSGYYVYYDKNPSMQQYMLDKPFCELEKEQVDDHVVSQFREIGQRRKKEYTQRRKTNFTVIAASIALLAVAAVVVKNQEQNSKLKAMQDQLDQASVSQKSELPTNLTDTENPFVFQPTETVEATSPSEVVETSAPVDTQKEEVATAEETTEVVKEEVTETKEEATVEENTKENQVADVTQEEEASEGDQETENVSNKDNYRVYVVEIGDTLRSISEKYFDTELRARDIIVLNEIDNGDHIYVGQELLIPHE